MPVFTQLSNIQKKLHDRIARQNRNANKHDAQFPSKESRAQEAQRRQHELNQLVAQSSADAMNASQPRATQDQRIEMAQESNRLRGVTIRRATDKVMR